MRRLDTVRSEIHNVLSTVRATERSASSSHRSAMSSSNQRQEDVFLLLDADSYHVQRLKSLHEYLLTFDTLEEVDCATFLDPFLLVIREGVHPLAVGVALASLNKLLLYGAIGKTSLNSKQGLNFAVEAVCQMKRTRDEVVHLQALEVLISLLRCGGEEISDLNVWGIVTECFEIAAPAAGGSSSSARSELLRAYAANQLGHVALLIFSSKTRVALQARLLKFLTKLTMTGKPAAAQNKSIILGLQLINICLETGVGHEPELLTIVQNDLFDSLLQNSQTRNLAVFALVLRVVYNLFSRQTLNQKVQLEIFLTSVHFHSLESAGEDNERRELAMESLLDFCHDRVLVLNLFANFDCDVKSCNLFERLCKLLFRFAQSEEGALNKLNVLALDGLFSIVSRLESRCNVDALLLPSEFLDGEEVWIRKHSHKRKLVQCANMFNRKAPGWLELARELGYVEDTDFFLAASALLDKQVLGDHLADNKPVLERYLEHFDMSNARIDEALRQVLTCFRIPGEAQKIDRVIEAFAARYFATSNQDSLFANVDSVFIFAFSIIMLHTDRHSRSINAADRMTYEQFARNVRGINNGSDFPPEFLRQVFDSVSEREFTLTTTASTSSPSPPPSLLPLTAEASLSQGSSAELAEFVHHVNLDVSGGPQERRMFEIVFDSMLQVVDGALPKAQPKLAFRLLRCATHLATIAQYFAMPDSLNLVLITLCKHFFLQFPLTLEEFDRAGMDLDEDDASFVLAKAVMNICLRNVNCVREAWANIVLLLSVLLHHGFIAGNAAAATAAPALDLMEMAKHATAAVTGNEAKESGGGASTLWSYFFANDAQGEDDEEELEERQLLLQRETLKRAYRKTVNKFFASEFRELVSRMRALLDEQSRAHLSNALWSPCCAAGEKPFAWSKAEESAQLLPSLLVLLCRLVRAEDSEDGEAGSPSFLTHVADECFEHELVAGEKHDNNGTLLLEQTVALFLEAFHAQTSLFPRAWSALLKLAATPAGASAIANTLQQDEYGLDNRHWFDLVAHMPVCKKGLGLVELRYLAVLQEEEAGGEEDLVVLLLLEVLNRYLEDVRFRARALRCFAAFPGSVREDSHWLLMMSMLKCYWEEEEEDGEGESSSSSVLDVFSALLFATTTKTTTNAQRGEMALEKLLFPMIVQSSTSVARARAQALLARYFLLLHSQHQAADVEDVFVRKHFVEVIHYLLLGGLDTITDEDARETLVQLIINLCNVVFNARETRAERMASVEKKLDEGLLGACWRDLAEDGKV